MTLTFDGDRISAKPFADGLRAFIAVLNAISHETTGSYRALRWIINVHEGSACAEFTVEQMRSTAAAAPANVTDTCERALVALEKGLTLPAKFPERAIAKMRALASTLDGGKHGITGIRVRRADREHAVTMKTVANIDAMAGVGYRDWGTIEGRLQTLSGRARLEFRVYDRLTDRPTICYFDDDLLEEVPSGFTRRVSVSGRIRFRADGEPVAMDVIEFRILPQEEDLPSAEDMVGILTEDE